MTRHTVGIIGRGVVAERLRRVVARPPPLRRAADVAAPIMPCWPLPVRTPSWPPSWSPAGIHVVSTSGSTQDVRELLDLDDVARAAGATLVVGAAVSPGLSGLLARHLAGRLAGCDELHVAVHGTAGPACAREHHRALRGWAIGWHDDSGSSGRPAAAASCAGSRSPSGPATATAPRCPIRGCCTAASPMSPASAPGRRPPDGTGSRPACRCSARRTARAASGRCASRPAVTTTRRPGDADHRHRRADRHGRGGRRRGVRRPPRRRRRAARRRHVVGRRPADRRAARRRRPRRRPPAGVHRRSPSPR